MRLYRPPASKQFSSQLANVKSTRSPCRITNSFWFWFGGCNGMPSCVSHTHMRDIYLCKLLAFTSSSVVFSLFGSVELLLVVVLELVLFDGFSVEPLPAASLVDPDVVQSSLAIGGLHTWILQCRVQASDSDTRVTKANGNKPVAPVEQDKPSTQPSPAFFIASSDTAIRSSTRSSNSSASWEL